MVRTLSSLIATLLLVTGATFGHAADNPYASVLEQGGVAPTREGIARFLRGLRPTGKLDALADGLIAKLGDDDFYTREDAEARLLAMPVVPFAKLAAAQESPDYEVRFRATRIIARARDGTREQILHAAFQTIQRTPLSGLTAELLGAMPVITEHWQRETAARALRMTAQRDDADRLRETLASTDALWIRSAALSALGAALGAEAADEIAAVLESKDVVLRFGAARALARLGDRRCIGAYLALLESPNGEFRQRAATDLRSVSRTQFGFVPYAEGKDRAAALVAWKKWAASDAKMVALDEAARGFVGRILLCRYSANEVREYDLSGKLLWKKTGLRQPFAGKGTPAGNRLFSLFDENVIVECDPSGKEIWRSPKLPGFISGLQRLDNGNTLAALGHAGRLLEIAPSGKIVWDVAVASNPMEATRLPDGRTLVALSSGAIEIDRSGKRLWTLAGASAYAAQRLADGTTVLTHMGSGVSAYSRDGRKLWSIAGSLGGIYRGQVLPNGNLVVADSSGLKIIDRAGKVLLQVKDTGGTVYVSAY